jgi:hypothetical protein
MTGLDAIVRTGLVPLPHIVPEGNARIREPRAGPEHSLRTGWTVDFA